MEDLLFWVSIVVLVPRTDFSWTLVAENETWHNFHLRLRRSNQFRNSDPNLRTVPSSSVQRYSINLMSILAMMNLERSSLTNGSCNNNYASKNQFCHWCDRCSDSLSFLLSCLRATAVNLTKLWLLFTFRHPNVAVMVPRGTCLIVFAML